MTIELLNRIEDRTKEALAKPSSVSEITVKVSTPYVGWIDVTLSASDGQSYTFNMSDVYDPLEDLRNLLEGWYGINGVKEIVIDCEHYRAVLSMQTFYREHSNGGEFLGLLKCYDDKYSYEDSHNGDLMVVLVNYNKVAVDIYTALKNQILNSEYNSEEWHINDLPDEVDDDDDPDKFRRYLYEKRVKSKYLERMIKFRDRD